MTSTTLTDGWAAFAKAAREVNNDLERSKHGAMTLVDELVARLRPIATDEIDAANLAADLFALQAFVARSRLAVQSGKPPPKLPQFSSEFAQGVIRRFRMILVSFAESTTEIEVARLASFLGSLNDQDPKLANGEPLPIEIAWMLLAMHPDDAAIWIRTNLIAVAEEFAS
jgi:hypothetical protein